MNRKMFILGNRRFKYLIALYKSQILQHSIRVYGQALIYLINTHIYAYIFLWHIDHLNYKNKCYNQLTFFVVVKITFNLCVPI